MNVAQQSPNLLKTRQHFEILDGLRGVAAVAVVIFHFIEFSTPKLGSPIREYLKEKLRENVQVISQNHLKTRSFIAE